MKLISYSSRIILLLIKMDDKSTSSKQNRKRTASNEDSRDENHDETLYSLRTRKVSKQVQEDLNVSTESSKLQFHAFIIFNKLIS